ncbi:ABC transporter ATP-binding protein [Vibrio mimicus]|uniref:ABC transporter ATP-binding protein n=1 Tax=Vibrio mimicus TaxID=674 RepID=UPI00076B304F|nr:ABC transporter ATP-binding protein [Vibrio mimicus]AMG04879.1 ABC transporter ATP-binding protein [Vibrio mimicus]KAA3491525.1 ABC transporter ATP-binding protein [Vibrio mimicus]
MNEDVVLSVKQLETEFMTDNGPVKILHGVSFDVKKGRTLGLVGESGCGKSVTAMSIMGLLPKPYGRVIGGEILYRGTDLVKLPPKEMYSMRGDRISIIFQDPMTALNPVHTVGKQLMEVLALHRPELNRAALRKHALEMLEKVRIPMADKRLDEYPHNLSGGMRQRVMIAMALACKPEVLICDEPTTALDVTVQASILELIQDLQQETDMAVIFITHDLGVVAEVCDEVAVMYAGKVVEHADVFSLFDEPQHPYTERLMSLMPSLEHTPKQLISIKPIDPQLFPEFKG